MRRVFYHQNNEQPNHYNKADCSILMLYWVKHLIKVQFCACALLILLKPAM